MEQGHLNPAALFQYFEEGEEQERAAAMFNDSIHSSEEQGGRGKSVTGNDPESKTEQHRLADGAHGSRRHECTSGDRAKAQGNREIAYFFGLRIKYEQLWKEEPIWKKM